MNKMDKKYSDYVIFSITLVVALITYGFSLINHSLTIDNEMQIFPDFAMELGRWGQNLVVYHILNGHTPFFTTILSLILYSVSALKIANLFEFENYSKIIFCLLFITFPQISYQIVFQIMAVIAGLGILLSVYFTEIFKNYTLKKDKKNKDHLQLAVAVLILVFTLAMYQAFIIVPVVLYTIIILLNTDKNDFVVKTTIKNGLFFVLILIISLGIYFISVKMFCENIQDNGYLLSFISSGSNSQENMFSVFYTILKENLKGDMYFGEKTYLLCTVGLLLLMTMVIYERKNIAIKLLMLLGLLLFPFIISLFITNGYHPPRIYLASNIVFSFILIKIIEKLNKKYLTATNIIVSCVVLYNVFLVTKLYQSSNKIFENDKKIAQKIDFLINSKFPEFYKSEKYVYFHGSLPFDFHQNLRVEKSEIFGGSFFNWDNGNNFRIINFINNVDYNNYKIIDQKIIYDKINQEELSKMPVWPNPESVKVFGDVTVVKFSDTKGVPLPFE